MGTTTTKEEVIGKVKLESVRRAKIYPGNIILVRNREMIPADMILLATSVEGGATFIETSSIDGETNLKLRNVPKIDNNDDDNDNDNNNNNKKAETLEEAIIRIANITCLGYPNGIPAT